VKSAENETLTDTCTVTVETPQTITLSFTDQGAGAFSQDGFEVKKGGSESVSLGSPWTTGEWLVDGEVRASGPGFTVNGDDYAVGGHTLQVLVQDGGTYWSRTVHFTVSN
jgi:hypothetical protein